MPFSATVYNVLIASPSDVQEERAAIAQSLHEWNSLYSQEQGKILLPVMWETHSAPAMGDRPQGLINEQVVRGCDILVGSFWTRIGSPTGKEISGTVEEINWFLKQKRPVMLYFSKKAIEPDEIDPAQYEKLRAFKESVRDKGIQESYRGVNELKEKLGRHLTIVMREMSTGPVIDRKVVEAARASTRPERSDSGPSPSLRVPDLEVRLVDYTDKAFIVAGNTSAIKAELTAAGGKWISVRTGGKAWMFSKKKLGTVAKIVGLPEVLETA